MSYHNLLFMDFKVPPIWPLPPSSNWSPTPSPPCPPPPTTRHKPFPASRHPHFLLPHPKYWWLAPSFNSDLYPNITSERCPLKTSLALFISPYPTTLITSTWNCISYLLMCLLSQLKCQNVSSPKAVTLIMVLTAVPPCLASLPQFTE